MAPEKRNHFLDADDSEDDNVQYNSEDDLQKGGRTAKRRKVEDESDVDVDDDDDDLIDGQGSDHEDAESPEAKRLPKPDAAGRTDEQAGPEKEDSSAKSKPEAAPLLARPLSKKNLVATDAAIKRSGVVYLSRIPPFMKPAKLRSLLEVHGKINRIYLAPQDPAKHTRRVRAGGNRKKMYTEGWVEFVNKKDAKRVCELLNAQTIGGKKGSYYRDDIWSLLYLKGFKWHNLTEQIAAESAERSNRMMAEISRSTRENKEFVRKVEQAKVLDGMRSKKAAKKKNLEGREGDDDASPAVNMHATEKTRTFKQKSLAKQKEEPPKSDGARKAISKIF